MVLEKRLCRATTQVIQVRNLADLSQTKYVSVPTFPYDVGSNINLQNTAGCWGIIGTSNSSDIPAEDIPTQICVPVVTLYAIQLGFHQTNATLACQDPKDTYYADSQYFHSFTKLYQSNSASPQNFAPTGYYSNHSGYRYNLSSIQGQSVTTTVYSCTYQGNNDGITLPPVTQIGEEE